MKQYRELLREYLSDCAFGLRMQLELSQETMAERLRISYRAYGDLERGKFCFSALALMFLLLLMDERERGHFFEEFKRKVYELEDQYAA